MIIDLILDRKDGEEYNARDFYYACLHYGEVGDDITRALDDGTEEDVRKALCDYIIRNDYNPKICNYINKVTWLEDEATSKELNESLSMFDEYNKFLDNEKVQNTIISNDYVREQIISALEGLVKELEDTIDGYKKLDKELKL